ncbi:hypothetical protein ACLMAL_08010 [Nocardia sp. CWNU-33]|uniref:hypothetical protein n=1 Tax=Nocardia sp. CWNU-33 TaxID=3392117 RepID=UPI00398EAB65
MSDNPADQRLAAEQRARVLIDSQLVAAGWVVQDRCELNLFAAQGVAVREAVMARGHGRADYLLYVDKKVVGVIEAKPMGTPLSGVEWRSSHGDAMGTVSSTFSVSLLKLSSSLRTEAVFVPPAD